MCAKWRSPAAYSDGSAALGGRARGRRLVMRRLRVVCRLLVRSQYAPSARADRQTHRVAALISPESDTGGELRSASFSGGVRSPFSSMVRAEGRRDRGAIEGGTRRINIGSDMNQRARHTRSPHARRSPDDAGRSAHLRLRDPVWGLLSRLRYMLGGAQVAASMTPSPGLARLEGPWRRVMSHSIESLARPVAFGRNMCRTTGAGAETASWASRTGTAGG
jgi:hypothetical protein